MKVVKTILTGIGLVAGLGLASQGLAKNVVCKSDNYDYKECSINSEQTFFKIDVKDEWSKKGTCIEGETYGLKGQDMWVSDGCRARFTVSLPGVPVEDTPKTYDDRRIMHIKGVGDVDLDMTYTMDDGTEITGEQIVKLVLLAHGFAQLGEAFREEAEDWDWSEMFEYRGKRGDSIFSDNLFEDKEYWETDYRDLPETDYRGVDFDDDYDYDDDH